MIFTLMEQGHETVHDGANIGIVDAVSVFLVLTGAVFCLLAGVGVARMPDLYMRMQAATKSGTLGVGSVLLGVAVYFRNLDVLVQCGLVILFLFLTAPIASHLLARAAYLVRIKPWRDTEIDELAGCYEPETHRLAASPIHAVVEPREDPYLTGDETMYGDTPDGPPRTG
ncbi:MAG: monovalent cation/H(+) antiporter subunit G [Planctomycetota bacterium]